MARREGVMGDEGDKPSAVILAAGKGRRMGSDLAKVAHPVGGRAMVCAVVDACVEAGVGRIVVVVGYGREVVEAALGEYEVEFAVQDEQLGTGHAVRCAEEALGELAWRDGHEVFVLCGDGPLIRSETLETMLQVHRRAGAAATLATSVIEDPSGYGRIVRDEDGRFAGIVEEKVATPAQREIREVNPSYYCFEAPALFSALKNVERNPVSGEYYVTDVPSILMDEGRTVEVVAAVPPEDVLSINTPEDLARVDAIYRGRSVRGPA
jgi:bifunctional UDP-N-acetylglucosamine pyrophosphorylase/glucosamine-1-phosphate N-acetyltransferase